MKKIWGKSCFAVRKEWVKFLATTSSLARGRRAFREGTCLDGSLLSR